MDSFEKLVEFAVSKEEEAASFYEFLASVTEKKHIRKLLEQFAREERAHKKVFENLGKKGPFPGGEHRPHPMDDMKISDYLVDQPFDPKMDFQDTLILAMKREEKAYHFYRDLAGRMEDTRMADLLMRLAEEEARHKSRLEEEYDKEVLQQN